MGPSNLTILRHALNRKRQPAVVEEQPDVVQEPEEMEMATPPSNTPVYAQFSSENLVTGGGVAIFHIKSGRVVICSTQDRHGRNYYFLPKGRRDAGEEGGTGAEREGYEESGYRNRLLPLPTNHWQPQAHPRIHAPPLTAEPVWAQLMPMGRSSTKQYIVYWYIAETLPPSLESELKTKAGEPYMPPPGYPKDLSLKDRMAMEPNDYEPIHHEGTGVDEDEQAYKSYLIPVEEAIQKLGKTDVLADVVRRGWKGIQDRIALEDRLGEMSHAS